MDKINSLIEATFKELTENYLGDNDIIDISLKNELAVFLASISKIGLIPTIAFYHTVKKETKNNDAVSRLKLLGTLTRLLTTKGFNFQNQSLLEYCVNNNKPTLHKQLIWHIDEVAGCLKICYRFYNNNNTEKQ